MTVNTSQNQLLSAPYSGLFNAHFMRPSAQTSVYMLSAALLGYFTEEGYRSKSVRNDEDPVEFLMPMSTQFLFTYHIFHGPVWVFTVFAYPYKNDKYVVVSRDAGGNKQTLYGDFVEGEEAGTGFGDEQDRLLRSQILDKVIEHYKRAAGIYNNTIW